MSREDTTPLKHAQHDADGVDLGLEAARRLFAHVELSAAGAEHAERAREIYDLIRRLAVQREASGSIARARADTVAAPFKAGESGVSPKVR